MGERRKGAKGGKRKRALGSGTEKSPKGRDMTLRIATWNVDGFNDPARRVDIAGTWNVDGMWIAAYPWENLVYIAVITESRRLDRGLSLDPGEGGERIMLITLDH